MYRRAQAYHRKQNPENAMQDIKAALALEPNDVALRKLVEVVRRDLAANARQQKDFWTKSFEKNSGGHDDARGGAGAADGEETINSSASESGNGWVDVLKSPWVWLMGFCKRSDKHERDDGVTDGDGAKKGR
jgi:hypothetical protein